ncbi:carbonic anhydrase [Floricoccus tropicus]|uniref:carbonic anhydrase n=1 Tax=Floricoccus tropicus TaxID=1859473 RepID=A0A1E8GPX5_9LACT|nr:carbonic anhydrase family protein [Floricoccus tropicus]OFI49663.1 carbonic anhydrase [Floricoccus tropicus]
MTIKRNMDVEWNYTGDLGPENWHNLCDWYSEGAKYPYQSPISLNVKDCDSLPIEEELSIHHLRERFTEKEFKNTIHFVPYNTESYVVFKGEKYHLTDIHFHLPCEHEINGKTYDLEVHLVHTNNHQENLVLGALYNLSDELNWIDDNNPENIWDFENHEEFFNPSIFLPNDSSFFHYLGSLTTPPTSGPINWFVFDKIGKMSRNFINQFSEEILANNNRPLQDRRDRDIYYK